MSKKLAVGQRKAAMAGQASATKRELIEGGRSAAAQRQGPAQTVRPGASRRPKTSRRPK